MHKLINGAHRRTSSFDSRLLITIDILNKLVDSVNSLTFDPYEQLLFKALFLFAFFAFARVGELVTVHGSNPGHVIQLEDISISAVSDDVQSVHVSFKRFKHYYVGTPKVVSFSHGDTKILAVKMLIDFLQHRHKNGGQLYCMQDGILLCRSHFEKIYISVCLFVA